MSRPRLVSGDMSAVCSRGRTAKLRKHHWRYVTRLDYRVVRYRKEAKFCPANPCRNSYRESFDQSREHDPRNRAHGRGNVDSSFRECAQPQYSFSHFIPRRRRCQQSPRHTTAYSGHVASCFRLMSVHAVVSVPLLAATSRTGAGSFLVQNFYVLPSTIQLTELSRFSFEKAGSECGCRAS